MTADRWFAIVFGALMLALLVAQWLIDRHFSAKRDRWLKDWTASNDAYLAKLAALLGKDES